MANERQEYRDFEELVFENRNKEYGAYDLRKSYRGYLTKAFFIGTSLFLGMIILPVMYFKVTQDENAGKDIEVKIDLEDVTIPDELPEEEVKEEEIFEEPPQEKLQSLDDIAPASDEPPAATIQNIIPEPKQDVKIETPPPTKEDLAGKAISTKTQEGAAVTNNAPTLPKGVEGGRGTQELDPNAKIVDKPVDNKVIHESVDIEADFPGSINAFRTRVQENFDTEAVEGEGILSTMVTFVVEIDGSITQVKASGSNSDFNREAERVVKSIRTRWKPAKKGGHNVRSRFKFPLKMRFE